MEQKQLMGITNQILRVNLTSGVVSTEQYPSELVTQYLGARGLGAYYLFNEVDPKCDPLGEANKLIFFNGPLSGTMIPGNNKVCVTFKSPLSESYSYSLCGGHWGPELKYAGFDGLIVEGTSETPVYLWIDKNGGQIRPAGSIWGQKIPDAQEWIDSELGVSDGKSLRLQSAIIGPAGEKLNKYAGITAGLYREFGRGGAGTVMGSKLLKAIVIHGNSGFSVGDLQAMKALGSKLVHQLRNSPGGKIRRQYGTPEMVQKINGNEFLITRNFQESKFESADKIDGPSMREAIVVGDSSCFGCPVGCGKRSFVHSEKYGDMLIEGPEFETIGMLGSNCGVSDWESIVRGTEICDTYGFDTMNAGGCVAFAMECYETGLITKEDTGGIDLRFGNGEGMVQILELIARREGIGNILAEGLRFAAIRWNASHLAMESKGQAFAVYDPRGCKSMALTYATSPKGAHHMIATTMGAEINTNTRLEYLGKAQLQREHQFSMAIVDSLGLCATMRAGITPHDMAEALSVVTGHQFSVEDLFFIAERILNLEKIYNHRAGFTRKDDSLPERFLKEPIPAGINKGEVVDLDLLLDEFYQEMGWDAEGIPTQSKLTELDLWTLVQDYL